jgi:signal transduction histidine kinase
MDIRFRVGQQGARNDFSPPEPPALFDIDGHTREQEQIAVSAIGSEFLVTLAHELRTPLTSLRTSFDLLKDPGAQTASKQDLRSLLDNMDRGITRLERQVSDLLEAGYLRAGGLVLRRQPSDLESMLAEALAEVSAAASWRRVAMEVAVDDDAPSVNVDPQRFQQILVNLLSNAIKYSAADGVVSIRAGVYVPDDDSNLAEDSDVPTTHLDEQETEDGKPRVVLRIPELRVVVADSGPGIGPELHRKVFQPFYRIRSEPNDDGAGAGAGLGLTIAHGLILLHGGRMWIRSDRGAGTEIGFGVPVSGQL